jgi:large subunit ribosomal protein L6
MSRIGNSPIALPSNVQFNMDGNIVTVTGPLGTLTVPVRPEVKVELADGQILVKRKKNDGLSRSLHGLTRSLIFNAVTGVEKGWEKRLELVGVGYRAAMSGNDLTLSVGYSHPVKITAPAGITFKVEENTKIVVSGIDKEEVGQKAAEIRSSRPPEPYQGKGVRYAGEYVRRKAGKAGKAGAK